GKNRFPPQPSHRYICQNQCGKILRSNLSHHCFAHNSSGSTHRPTGTTNLYVLADYSCSNRFVFYFQWLCLSDVQRQGIPLLSCHISERTALSDLHNRTCAPFCSATFFSGKDLQRQ